MAFYRTMASIAVLALTVLFTSCERPELDESGLPHETNSFTSFKNVNYSVEDGRVVIADKVTAANLILAIDDNPVEAYNHFTNQTLFTSSRSAYLKLIEEESLTEKVTEQFPKLLYTWYDRDQEAYIDHIVDYVGFEWITNQAGIVQIGEDVYDFSNRNELVYLPVDAYDFSDPGFQPTNHPQATSFDLKRRVVSLSEGDKTDIVTCRDDDNKRRVLGQLEASETLPWSSEDNYHVRTRFFKKLAFAWVGVQADNLESDWDLWIDVVDVVPDGVPMFPGPPVATSFQGTHVAAQGDRQNTRHRLIGPVHQNSRYISGSRTNIFAGNHRSNNRGSHDGRNPACTCNLR